MKHQRGAVLAETALFVSAALLFMLGSIQIGVIGFFQLDSDAAAYFDARANVLAVASGSPEQATHNVFHEVPVPNISATILPAPTPSIPVDYGYNDPDSTVRSNSATQRHGGASMLTPAQEIATVNIPGLAHFLGEGIGTTASVTEPVWQECGTHFDVSNELCSIANPGANSETNYFSEGENTPPYMVGRNIMQTCNNTQPFGVYMGAATSLPSSTTYAAMNDGRGSYDSSWQTCDTSSNSNLGYLAEGTAEFLYSANWADIGTGGSGSNGGGISGPPDIGGKNQNVFQAVAYHQRVYSALAAFFATHRDLYVMELYSQLWDSNGSTNYAFNSNNVFAAQASIPNYAIFGSYNINIYNVSGLGDGTDSGNIAIPEAIQTFESWEGFDDATHGPAASCKCDTYNQLVQQVYSWDVPVQAGEPVSNPTYNNPTNPENEDS